MRQQWPCCVAIVACLAGCGVGARSSTPDAAAANVLGSPSASDDAGATADAGALCEVWQEYVGQCGSDDPCTQAELAECPAFEAQFSDIYLSAVGACFTAPFECEGDAAATTDCFYAAIAAGRPSPAQERIKDDFCRQCPDGTSSVVPKGCSEFFTVPAGSATSLGVVVLLFDDSIVDEMDSACTGSAAADAGADCVTSFLSCTARIARTHGLQPPSACPDGGGMQGPLPVPR